MRRLVVAVVCAVSPLLGACGGSPSPSSAGTSPSGGGETRLTVAAAASLTAAFTSLGKEFEAAHPGVKVDLSFGGSSSLVAQLEQGAPGDVFASADTKNMDKAVSAGVVAPDVAAPFATNTLTIVTPPGNPKKVAGVKDLARADVATVVCAPQVPCGSATGAVAAAAGVTIHAVSEENAVTDVLGKVTSGQADAGVVYVTDARRAGATVVEVPFPEAKAVVNVYPIAVTRQAADPALAKQFVDLVRGPSGRSVLGDAGFGAPTS